MGILNISYMPLVSKLKNSSLIMSLCIIIDKQVMGLCSVYLRLDLFMIENLLSNPPIALIINYYTIFLILCLYL